MSADLAKLNAAQAALEFVKDGMVLGLGTARPRRISCGCWVSACAKVCA
jgi:hypothetical protein